MQHMRCDLRASHTSVMPHRESSSPEKPQQALLVPWGTPGAEIVTYWLTKPCLISSIFPAHNTAFSCKADHLPRPASGQ